MCCLGWSQLSFQGASVLISWLQSLSVVILEPAKIKSLTVYIQGYGSATCFFFHPVFLGRLPRLVPVDLNHSKDLNLESFI